MNISKWIDEMTTLLEELNSRDEDYLVGGNRFRPIDMKSKIREVELLLHIQLPDGFKSLYDRCDGISMMGVWVGYDIFDSAFMLKSFQRNPKRVEGWKEDIFVFGRDGGGNLFAISLSENEQVIYLPDPVHLQGESVYRTSRPIHLITANFDMFLQKLLEDVSAFVGDHHPHTYLDGGTSS